jgi:bacillithiol system protein YtxJ
MNWLSVSNEDQLLILHERSSDPLIGCVFIFKHSTRCSISVVAKDRLEKKWDLDQLKFPIYYLDVLNSRAVSNQVAEQYGIEHQSPQLLLIKDGKCISSASHSEVSVEMIHKVLNS